MSAFSNVIHAQADALALANRIIELRAKVLGNAASVNQQPTPVSAYSGLIGEIENGAFTTGARIADALDDIEALEALFA